MVELFSNISTPSISFLRGKVGAKNEDEVNIKAEVKKETEMVRWAVLCVLVSDVKFPKNRELTGSFHVFGSCRST